jgi:hypothetical protein
MVFIISISALVIRNCISNQAQLHAIALGAAVVRGIVHDSSRSIRRKIPFPER